MAGQIKKIIDTIIQERSKGNPTIVATTQAKLVLKGINLSAWTTTSEDDPQVISKIKSIARELGITLWAETQ
jgi:hypothetical protein